MIDHHLQAMDIAHLFCLVVKSVEHGLRKPHAKIFEDTLAQLRIRAEQALYIGDSFENDYQGAKGVKLNSILIDSERRYLALAGERVDHLYDVRAVVRSWGVT